LLAARYTFNISESFNTTHTKP